jgi:UDP-glucose 4-epimerase
MEQKFDFPCKFEQLDVTDEAGYRKMVENHGATYIVHLAGILSALGE